MSMPTNIDELLTGYLDGYLSDSERRYLEAELAKSPELVLRFDQLRENAAALRQLPKRSLPSNFAQRVLAAAHQEAVASGLPADHYVLSQQSLRLVTVAKPARIWATNAKLYSLAGLAAVLVLAYMAFNPWKGGQPGQDQIVAQPVDPGSEMPVDSPVAPELEPKTELVGSDKERRRTLEGIVASQSFLVVVDVYPTADAWESKLIGRLLDAASIKWAKSIVAADVAEALNAARSQESNIKGQAAVIFVNADFGSVAEVLEELFARTQEFPTVTFDIAIDRPAVGLLQRLTQAVGEVADFSKPFAVGLADKVVGDEMLPTRGFVARSEPSNAPPDMDAASTLRGLQAEADAFAQVLLVVHLPE